MEIILLEDVKTLGKKGQIVKVSDGYGRNIIAKKLGLEATAKKHRTICYQRLGSAFPSGTERLLTY